jgi:pyruvate dehydrogenase E1 component beta subunit
MQKNKFLIYKDAINMAIDHCLKSDKNLICYGLGINDPKRIFNTTKGLFEKHSEDRVFDVPNSENSLMGIAVGASLNGTKVLVTHQRLDFFLLAMDQLVNAASKWFYMFGGKKSVPITIRLIIGRGWGQGPTHSQNLQSIFNHIPGIKIVMPTFANDAKQLLIESIKDLNPVLFLEHRWLHETKEIKKKSNAKIGKAKLCMKGNDLTIVSMSYLTIEAIKACRFLKKEYNIKIDLIDLRTIKPLDWNMIFKSVNKTKKLICLDTGFSTNSVSSDIISKVCERFSKNLKMNPVNLAMRDIPDPTSRALSNKLYLRADKLASFVLKKFGKKFSKSKLKKELTINSFLDIPGDNFKGPF